MPKEEGQFGKGQSGNPAGRPRGARNRVTLAMEALLEGEAEALTRKAIEMALEGDGPAMRLCLDRLCPPRKDRPVRFDLPEIATADDVMTARSRTRHVIVSSDSSSDRAAGPTARSRAEPTVRVLPKLRRGRIAPTVSTAVAGRLLLLAMPGFDLAQAWHGRHRCGINEK